MTPKKSGKKGLYEFMPSSIVEIRKRLKLSQAAMANLLGVPPNTLSRWETGATVPDANYLALVYSVAKEHNITPVFFGMRRESQQAQKSRYRLIVMWDFQTLGVPAGQVTEADTWIRTEVQRRFSGVNFQLFKHLPIPINQARQIYWKTWAGACGKMTPA